MRLRTCNGVFIIYLKYDITYTEEKEMDVQILLFCYTLYFIELLHLLE